MKTEEREVQESKAVLLMAVTEVGITTVVRDVNRKAANPIPVTVVGINTVVMVEHRSKAKSGMNVTSLGMVMTLLAPHEEQSLQGK